MPDDFEDLSFDRTYEGLKLLPLLLKPLEAMPAFDRTYEGLKRPRG